jgi:hypothetical protein
MNEILKIREREKGGCSGSALPALDCSINRVVRPGQSVRYYSRKPCVIGSNMIYARRLKEREKCIEVQ